MSVLMVTRSRLKRCERRSMSDLLWWMDLSLGCSRTKRTTSSRMRATELAVEATIERAGIPRGERSSFPVTHTHTHTHSLMRQTAGGNKQSTHSAYIIRPVWPNSTFSYLFTYSNVHKIWILKIPRQLLSQMTFVAWCGRKKGAGIVSFLIFEKCIFQKAFRLSINSLFLFSFGVTSR